MADQHAFAVASDGSLQEEMIWVAGDIEALESHAWAAVYVSYTPASKRDFYLFCRLGGRRALHHQDMRIEDPVPSVSIEGTDGSAQTLGMNNMQGIQAAMLPEAYRTVCCKSSITCCGSGSTARVWVFEFTKVMSF